MWHPDGLPGEVPFPCLDRGSHLGCVCHDPRVSGHVRHDPQTAAAGPRGMGATTPVLRGMCATTPVLRGMGATTPTRATPPARARSYVPHRERSLDHHGALVYQGTHPHWTLCRETTNCTFRLVTRRRRTTCPSRSGSTARSPS